MKNKLFLKSFILILCLTLNSYADMPPAEQGEVWGLEQDQLAAKILEHTKSIVDKNQKPGEKAHRDAHPKAHGCVKAIWNPIQANLKPEQKVGLFANEKPVLAWLRFSNGAPDGYNAPDSKSDVRGFAVKLMAPYGSHDFVAINSPRFFSRDGEDYVDLFDALEKKGLSLFWYLLRNPKNIMIVKKAQTKIDSVLSTTYFTPVPLKLGAQSMRMKFSPCDSNKKNIVKVSEKHANYLQEGLLASLTKSEMCYEVYIQPNMEPELNLIENPTLEWDESKSPFVKVAKLDLLKQDDFASSDRMNFCENLSFNPWHTHADNRPMGQINRIRKLVYDEISKYRHQKNSVQEIEPTDHSACSGSAAALCK